VASTGFAHQTDVPSGRISQIISGKRSVTSDTAFRFGHWFGIDPQFWNKLQAHFDLAVANKAIGGTSRQLPTKASLPPVFPARRCLLMCVSGVRPNKGT
jgi:addiction module HigA family antidote